MGLNLDDVIVAISSSPGPAARGVIRLTGDDLFPVLKRLFRSLDFEFRWTKGKPFTELAFLNLGGDQSVEGRLIVWPSRRSYTRQPSAEFHTLGSSVVLNLMVAAAGRAGARLANRGEFTLRAFLAGRIDLTQAEAILGLIDAESQESFHVALRQSSGGLATPFSQLREQLVDLLAEIEATLDFIDQDIEFISREKLLDNLKEAQGRALKLQSQIDERGELNEIGCVVLAGEPNAGKSTLFNRLAGADLAIVSPQSGTTRDSLVARVEYHGQTWELFDTAGIEEVGFDPSASPIAGAGVEQSAQMHTKRRLEQAEVVLWCVLASQVHAGVVGEPPVLKPGAQLIKVATQADQSQSSIVSGEWQSISAVTGEGIEVLLAKISEAITRGTSAGSEVMPATAIRCRESVRAIVAALEQATNAANHGWGDELVASELRVALDNLGQIAGTVYNDEILGRIFTRFCIGK